MIKKTSSKYSIQAGFLVKVTERTMISQIHQFEREHLFL